MQGYSFRLDFQVRDYECDMEGIVNNAVYMNYLEHARHEFMKSVGLEYAELVRRKVFLVVVRAELDYKRSLRSGERFWVGVNVERVSRIRFAFLEDIFLQPDDRPVLCGRIVGTGVDEGGRPMMPVDIENVLLSQA